MGVTGNSEQQGPSPSLTQMLSGALGCLGPSPCPSRAPQLPGRTARTLEVACRVHTHPALPLSNVPPPPTPPAQHRGTEGLRRLDPSKWRGRQRPSFQQPSICHVAHLAHPPSSTSAEVMPSFPLTRPLPRPARSRPFLFSPQAHGPIPLREAALPQPEGPLLAHPLTRGGTARPVSTLKLASGAQPGGGRSGAETGLSAPSSWFQRAPW